MQTGKALQIERFLGVLFWSFAVAVVCLVLFSNYLLTLCDFTKYALCALACIGFYLWKRSKLSRFGRRLAGLSLLALFLMNLYGAFWPGPDSITTKLLINKDFENTDFRHFHYGAEAVYKWGLDPYSWNDNDTSWVTPGMGYPNAFPFPTYYLYHLLSMGFYGDLPTAGIIGLAFAFCAAVVSLLLTIALLPKMSTRLPLPRSLFVLCLGWNISVIDGLSLIQSSMFCFFLIATGLCLWTRVEGKWSIVLTALLLSLAVLMKPTTVFILMFFVSSSLYWLFKNVFKKKRDADRKTAIVGLWAMFFTLVLPLITLLIPGGLTLSHYQVFPQRLTLSTAMNTGSSLNFSPLAIFQTRIEKGLGLSDRIVPVNLTSFIVFTLIMVLLMVLLYRFGNRNKLASVSPWLAATLLPFPFIWTFYVPFVIPVLCYLFARAVDRLEGGSFEAIAQMCLILALLQNPSSFLYSAGFVLLFIRAITNQFEESERKMAIGSDYFGSTKSTKALSHSGASNDITPSRPLVG